MAVELPNIQPSIRSKRQHGWFIKNGRARKRLGWIENNFGGEGNIGQRCLVQAEGFNASRVRRRAVLRTLVRHDA